MDEDYNEDKNLKLQDLTKKIVRNPLKFNSLV